jgi:hypothetical protein
MCRQTRRISKSMGAVSKVSKMCGPEVFAMLILFFTADAYWLVKYRRSPTVLTERKAARVAMMMTMTTICWRLPAQFTRWKERARPTRISWRKASDEW